MIVANCVLAYTFNALAYLHTRGAYSLKAISFYVTAHPAYFKGSPPPKITARALGHFWITIVGTTILFLEYLATALIQSFGVFEMREVINKEVSVIMVYSARKQQALPHLINWQNRDFKVGKIGYHHKVYEGKILHHIFELVDDQNTLWFRLNLNTDNLHWLLEAVSDGNPN